MKNSFLLLFSFVAFTTLTAQDAYHTYLSDFLQSDYGVTGGDWVFSDTENAILNDSYAYGGSNTVEDATDQVFSRKSRITVSQAGSAPWDAGWGIRNNIAVQNGDVVLVAFYLRAIDNTGEVSLFVEDVTTFAKEIYFNLPVGTEWRRYLIPFQSGAAYSVDGMAFGFHLASQAQTIEIGGFTAINYGNSVALEDLPDEANNQFYEGYEEDHPWRSAAADRIESLRKANLTITAKDNNGNPIEDADIQVEMLQHEFAFGTAVQAARVAGNNAHSVIFENKLLNLDGEGHGFNYVVFENDLKWDAWEEEWFVDKTELVNAVQWFRNHGIKIRGHNLVWPGNQYLPEDIPTNLNNINYIKNRIDQRLEEVLTFPGIAGEIEEWDVLNETVVNTDIVDAFRGNPGYMTGRELYPEIYEKARELDPNTGLWMNDYVTLTLNQTAGSVQYDELKVHAQELLDAGVDVEGIGFQGHIGGSPNSILEVLETFDDFYETFGLKTKITEYDVPGYVSPELAADYLRDILTATFSHPSADGFLFWSFWDGASWINAGSNLYTLSWEETLSHGVYTDLLFNQWWTDEVVSTNAEGVGTTRGFKGTYAISYSCDGMLVSDTITLSDNVELDIICDNITTSTQEIQELDFKVYPNPINANNQLIIEGKENSESTVRLLDVYGRTILEREIAARLTYLNLVNYGITPGIYFLELATPRGKVAEKIIIRSGGF